MGGGVWTKWDKYEFRFCLIIFIFVFLPKQGTVYQWLQRNLENLVCVRPSVCPQQRTIEILLSPLLSQFQSFSVSSSFLSLVLCPFFFPYPKQNCILDCINHLKINFYFDQLFYVERLSSGLGLFSKELFPY